MDHRQIHTKIWKDDYFAELSRAEKLMFFYLITNVHANLIGIYEVSDREIKFDTGIDESELKEVKEKFGRDGKFLFVDGWVVINNHDRYNSFNGELLSKAKEKELNKIPKEILDRVRIGYQYPIDTIPNTNTITNTNTNSLYSSIKSLNKEVLEELSKEYVISLKDVSRLKTDLELYCQSKGKSYKNYKATLQNWIRRDLDSGKIKHPVKMAVSNLPTPNPEGLKMLSSLKDKFKVRDL